MAKEYPKEFLSEFGKKVSEMRRLKGITQESLADATNLHRTYIGFIEQGKRDPTIGNVYKISKVLGISLSELFESL